MSYERLLPSMTEYSQKFRRLDSLDFKIVRAMSANGVHNFRRLAEAVHAPQQTVSYRIRRFDREDLVRFRALINESKLGLKSYSALASTQRGNEELSGRALTCFPLWRYLAVVDGWKNGNYVRYALPSDKERDIKTFLKELKKRTLISDVELYPTASPKYPLLDLDFYIKRSRASTFDWQEWIKNFDSFPAEKPEKPERPGRAEFDMVDLIILRCLELNARTTQKNIAATVAKVLGESRGTRFIPMVSRRIKKNINHQGLIKGCRVYLFPNHEHTPLFFLFCLDFPNGASLRKFAGALKHLPYNTSYERVLGKNTMFVRLIVPAFEQARMRQSFGNLAETGYIKAGRLLLGDLTHGTWDNVEMHQMYKDGTWNFNYQVAVGLLETALHTPGKELARKEKPPNDSPLHGNSRRKVSVEYGTS